jgi:hypothetical protein
VSVLLLKSNDAPKVTTLSTADVLCRIWFNCHYWCSVKYIFFVMYFMHSCYSSRRVVTVNGHLLPTSMLRFLIVLLFICMVSLVFSSVEGCIQTCKCVGLFIYFFCRRIILDCCGRILRFIYNFMKLRYRQNFTAGFWSCADPPSRNISLHI